MPRLISRYDRLRALVRNPDFLLDLEFVKRGVIPSNLKYEHGEPIKREDLERVDYSSLSKGFSPRAVAWFLEKYKLSIVLTPELVEKYPPQMWECAAIFTDDDKGVRILFREDPKMIEVEEGLYKYDYSVCFKKSSTLTIKIDLSKNKTEIMDKISSHIDLFKKYVSPSKSRRKPDEKVDRFYVWDEYRKSRDFSEITRKFKIDRTTVRKAYLRAFQDILGEKYDPIKHDRRRIKKADLTFTCKKCPNRETCDTICPEVARYVTQDKRQRKERLISDILPPDQSSNYFV